MDHRPKCKALCIKENNDNFDFIKIKSFFSLKDPVLKMKRQTIDWEKIFVQTHI